MVTSLELYKRTHEKDAKHQLVVRFSIGRKAYRYPTGFSLTEKEWAREGRSGYPTTKKAIEIEEKVRIVLDDLNPFDLKEFQERMRQPLVPKDAITRHWGPFIEHRDQLYADKKLTFRTREMDDNLKKKLDLFLGLNPHLDNIHVWTAATLNDFQQFMVRSVSVTTAKIYLEAFRTFFNWAIDQEIIYRDIWKKYRIPKGDSSWFPYSYKEVAMIFALKPKSEAQAYALRWTKLFLFSGGADPKDFAEMRWWQVQSEAIQMLRVKSARRSKAGKKLLYLSGVIKDLFDEIKGKRGRPDDYVLPIYSLIASESENLESHKYFMRKINKNMRNMLTETVVEMGQTEAVKNLLIDFKIKRIRPTAATIANASTKDVNFVSKMLMHSNLEQTSAYLQTLPNDEARENQQKYEQAIAEVSK